MAVQTQAIRRIYQLIVEGNQASREFDRLNRRSQAFGRSMRNIGGLVAAAFSGRAIVRFGSAMISTSDNLRLMESSLGALLGNAERGEDMFTRLTAVATEVGAPMEKVAQNVQRLSIGLVELGANNGQIASITESFLKLGRIAGSDINDLNGALYQLSQGLASGRLQGDELRSVMERVPIFATLLAEELDVAVGELWELGKQGKISGDIIANTLLKRAEEINEEFANLPFTFEQSMSQVRTQMQLLADDMVLISGLSDSVGGYLQDFAGGLEGFRLARLKGEAEELQTQIDELVVAFENGAQTIQRFSMDGGQDIEHVFGLTPEAFDADMQVYLDKLDEVQKRIDRIVKGKPADNPVDDLVVSLKQVNPDVLKELAENMKYLDKESERFRKLADEIKDGLYPERVLNRDIAAIRELPDEFLTAAEKIKAIKKRLDEDPVLIEIEVDAEPRGLDYYDKFKEKTQTLGDELTEAIEGFNTYFADTLISSIKEGENAFKAFGQSVLETITRIVLSKAFEQFFEMIASSVGGYFTGGATTTTAPATGLGPPTRAGTAGAGASRMVRGRMVPPFAGIGAGGGGRGGVNVIVNNNAPVEISASESVDSGGQLNIQLLVENSVKDSMASGALDSTMSANYGLRRRAF